MHKRVRYSRFTKSCLGIVVLAFAALFLGSWSDLRAGLLLWTTVLGVILSLVGIAVDHNMWHEHGYNMDGIEAKLPEDHNGEL